MKLSDALGKAIGVVSLMIIFTFALLFLIGVIIEGPVWVGPVVGLSLVIVLLTAIFYAGDANGPY